MAPVYSSHYVPAGTPSRPPFCRALTTGSNETCSPRVLSLCVHAVSRLRNRSEEVQRENAAEGKRDET